MQGNGLYDAINKGIRMATRDVVGICADFEMMLRLFWKHNIRAKYLPICTHVMRRGGLSTGGISSNIQINREDLRALRANGYWSCLPLIYTKYLFKIWGFLRRK